MAGHPLFAALYDRMTARAERAGLADLRAGVLAEVVEAGAESLPFADDSFDSVASTLALCTVDDPVRTVSEVARVLRPGGGLLLLEHVGFDVSALEPVQLPGAPPFVRPAIRGSAAPPSG